VQLYVLQPDGGDAAEVVGNMWHQMARSDAAATHASACISDITQSSKATHGSTLPTYVGIIAYSKTCLCLCFQADQADVRAFEASSAAARSQGLFFKNLYELPAEEDEDGSSSSGSSSGSSSSSSKPLTSPSGGIRKPLLDPAGARQAAAVVTSSAEEEVSSPFRLYLFGCMAAVLVLVVMQGE
jgi:hypothetical protein